MIRTALIAGVVFCVCGSWAAAQDSGLPAPPKPPKSKAKEAEKGAESAPADPAPAPSAGTDERGRHLDIPRPRRVRIDVPFFHMDLNLGGRGAAREAMPYRESPAAGTSPRSEAAPAPRAEEIPAPAPGSGQADAGSRDGKDWRYRWHDGRWWYWTPSERWVYWDSGRWNELAQPGRRLGALRNLRGLEGLNLKDLMQSDEIRIGQPRRGNIGLEFEGIPPVNFGF